MILNIDWYLQHAFNTLLLQYKLLTHYNHGCRRSLIIFCWNMVVLFIGILANFVQSHCTQSKSHSIDMRTCQMGLPHHWLSSIPPFLDTLTSLSYIFPTYLLLEVYNTVLFFLLVIRVFLNHSKLLLHSKCGAQTYNSLPVVFIFFEVLYCPNGTLHRVKKNS